MEFKLLLLIFYISTLTHGLELEVPQFLHNFCLSSTGYMSISEVGLYGCARRCGMDSGCKSFTYNTAHYRCLLNEDDANTASGQFNACPGFIYGDRAMVISDVSLMGPCSDHDCPDYTMCVRLSSTFGVCVVSACGAPPNALIPVNNDDISTTMSAVGDTRYLQCDPGYIGYKTAVCLGDGYWLELEDMCRDCGVPPSVANAVISIGDTTIGSNRVYQCSPTTTGSGAITCQQDGTWSTPLLLCIPDCVVITYRQNAHTVATVDPAGTNISYACNTGYTGGPGNRYCNTDGEWEALDIICNPVDCGQPPMPTGISSVSASSFTYQQTVSYTCGPGQVSKPASQMTITCQSDGQWSPILFQCT